MMQSLYNGGVRVQRQHRAESRVERSRFHALLFPISDLAEVKVVLEAQRKKHKKAGHHCWAARCYNADGQLVEQARDDREVGKPGMAILQVLRQHDIEGALVVSRIYGGIKLGPGGVGRAFRKAAQQVVATLD